MFDPNNENCKKCVVAIQYVKFRIGDAELKLNCKCICGRGKRIEVIEEPDLFSFGELRGVDNG